MKIEAYQMSMKSERSYTYSEAREENLDAWDQGRENNGEGKVSNVKNPVMLTISELAKHLQEEAAQSTQSSHAALSAQISQVAQSAQPVQLHDEGILKVSDADELKMQMVEKMIEMLTGHKYKIHRIEKMEGQHGNDVDFLNRLQNIKTKSAAESEGSGGWGINYHYHEMSSEEETMSFHSAGVVRTSDGREINFQAQLELSRKFVQETGIDFRAGDALKDPLVINYGGGAPQMTARKVKLDLDRDGQSERVAMLVPGSGYLVADWNGDGQVDDGSELFGPQTGQGFSELARLDQDGNGWIDEGDSTYGKLHLLIMNDQGEPDLQRLDSFQIGAIFTQGVSSEFSMKDSRNGLQGQLRRSGVFLKENGAVGTIQQIDLKV